MEVKYLKYLHIRLIVIITCGFSVCIEEQSNFELSRYKAVVPSQSQYPKFILNTANWFSRDNFRVPDH